MASAAQLSLLPLHAFEMVLCEMLIAMYENVGVEGWGEGAWKGHEGRWTPSCFHEGTDGD